MTRETVELLRNPDRADGNTWSCQFRMLSL